MAAGTGRGGRFGPRQLLGIGAVIALALAVFPQLASTYQTMLLAFGMIFAIAGLGFNLLLGYTGLLSFGHSAFFGVGAYAVAFTVREFGVTSMELLLWPGSPRPSSSRSSSASCARDSPASSSPSCAWPCPRWCGC